MNKMVSIIFIALLLSLLYVFVTDNNNEQSKKLESKVVGKIDSEMNSTDFKNFTGVVLIEHKDEIIYHNSFGENIDTNNAFWIGSLTKPFTAILVMKLVEDGKIELSDPISKYLSGVPNRMSEITIYHLLTHTSGLPDNYALDGTTDLSETMRILFNTNLEKPIGERNYTVLGYNILALIIEKVSHKPFEQFAKETILKMADMNHTGFWGYEDEINVRIAPIPSLYRDEIPESVFNNGRSIENYGYKGGTGIFSTSTDIHKLITALLQSKLLSKSITDELFKPHFLIISRDNADINQGFDWVVEYRNDMLYEIRKSGAEDWLSHNSILRFSPDGYKIIVLSNSGVYDKPGQLENVEWSTVVSIALRMLLSEQMTN